MGSYYTPEATAGSIVIRTIGRWIEENCHFKLHGIHTMTRNEKQNALDMLLGMRVLDPSVGNGIFLRAAGDFLETLMIKLDDTRDSCSIRKVIVNQNLFGVDIRKSAVIDCVKELHQWINKNQCESNEITRTNISCGNSLIGQIRRTDLSPSFDKAVSFDWHSEFPAVFSNEIDGFDVIVGNPPYGNFLSLEEKEYIKKALSYDVMSDREGSWNTAPVFIVRSKDLLNHRGQMGLLLPNSILRVGQFRKTRAFLRDEMNLWSVIDEGNPFEGVTLEMVSIFCAVRQNEPTSSISVISKRQGLEKEWTIPRRILDYHIISIYCDSILKTIRKSGATNLIAASRGRDIPSEHTSSQPSKEFSNPYATKGGSVRRYLIDTECLKYTDNWFKQDASLLDSFSNEFLVATKNYPYPRCALKPKGVIHGGGVVRIIPQKKDLDIKAIGLLLNSRMIRYVCTRYLTNYAQLTTCLNTGIMEEIPVILPEDSRSLAAIFDGLEFLHYSNVDHSTNGLLDTFANALVYGIYLAPKNEYTAYLHSMAESLAKKRVEKLAEAIDTEEINRTIREIMELPIIKKVESSPRMG